MMRSRLHDDAMAELYRNDPTFALEVVNVILEDGDQAKTVDRAAPDGPGLRWRSDGGRTGAPEPDPTLSHTLSEGQSGAQQLAGDPPSDEATVGGVAVSRHDQQTQ